MIFPFMASFFNNIYTHTYIHIYIYIYIYTYIWLRWNFSEKILCLSLHEKEVFVKKSFEYENIV